MAEPVATVTAADIARLTGFGRAAVSNWRRRHPDFPRPVGGTSASPLFSLAEVRDWLARTGKKTDTSDREQLWQRIRTTGDDVNPARAVAEFGRTAVARITAGRAASTHEPFGDAATFEFVVARYLETQSRRVSATPADTARMMAEVGAVEGAEVFDPACGVGALLMAAGDLGAAGAHGQDRDADTAAIAAARLSLAGRAADVRAGDSLRADAFPERRFEVALCDLPFGDPTWSAEDLSSDLRWVFGLPPRADPELAWIQHLLWHLAPGGRAVALLPAAVADRGSGRRIRAALLRTGTLRAVFALPVGAAANSPAIPLLWVLRQPVQGEPLPSRVLLADVSEQRLSRIPLLWRGFLAEPDSDPPHGRAIPVVELLDDRVDVNPLRFRDGGSCARTFDTVRSDTSNLLAEAVKAVSALSDPTPVPAGKTSTIDELCRSGALTLLRTTTATGSGDQPVLTAADAAARREPSGRGAEIPGVVVLEPGDVVVVAGRHPTAPLVVTAGGVLAGPRLDVYRPDPKRMDSDFLACVLHTAMTGRSAGASSSARSEIRRTAVAELTLANQRLVGADYRRLLATVAALRRASATGNELLTAGLGALAHHGTTECELSTQ
ncbi:N-6 DNA methylase [Nocardia takedensis]|uniref:N-6 DNA methylase n=1 Tax=Nocardia takedensis TaxID=259390 RepID=UPI0006844151|nr:N-6 DNA methylase [Nocardia takedensis]